MRDRAKKALRAAAPLVLLATAGIAHAAAGRVLAVDVDEPFVIEGKLCAPGTLTFRSLADLSPAVAAEEVRLDGVSLGRLAIRRGRPEVAWSVDAAVFARDPGGRLVLVGLARRAGSRAGSLRLASAPEHGREFLIAAR